jgi:antitoxin HicB
MWSYRLVLTPDENGTFIGTSPDFPELTTFGGSEGEAALNAIGAVEEAIAARIHDRRELPRPLERKAVLDHPGHVIPLPAMTALKIYLYRALRESSMTRADLARALGWHREQVDRLFRLDHASRIDQIAAALSALGKELDIKVRTRRAA